MPRYTVRDSRNRTGHRCPPDSVVEMPDSHFSDAYDRDPRIARRTVAAIVRLADGSRVLAARAWPVVGSRAELEVWAPSRAVLTLLDRRAKEKDDRAR